MFDASIKRLTVIGNACGGKTTLSRILADRYQLPLTHVDSIQFTAGMKIRPHAESIKILNDIQSQDSWLIDGYGPLDILEQRLQRADGIIFIDFPIQRHYWWAIKRQFKSLFRPRSELPRGCHEATFNQTLTLFKAIWKVHNKMRPEMLKILARENLKTKVTFIRTVSDFKKLSSLNEL